MIETNKTQSQAGEPYRDRTVLTAHPTWIGEFVKRAHKSVSSRIEVGAVWGTAGAHDKAAHLRSAHRATDQ